MTSKEYTKLSARLQELYKHCKNSIVLELHFCNHDSCEEYLCNISVEGTDHEAEDFAEAITILDNLIAEYKNTVSIDQLMVGIVYETDDFGQFMVYDLDGSTICIDNNNDVLYVNNYFASGQRFRKTKLISTFKVGK